jgi:acetyl-CoA acetyltransferase
MERNPRTDWSAVDDLIFGCANQAGEDNRNVGRMAVLLAGMPVGVPGTTVNRLCGSGMDAVGMAARAIKAGDCDFVVAGGVEHDPRSLRHAEGGQRLVTLQWGLRHDDRLAVREPGHEEAIWHRLDATDRGQCRRRFQYLARRPGCVCRAFAGPLGGSAGEGFSRTRSCP